MRTQGRRTIGFTMPTKITMDDLLNYNRRRNLVWYQLYELHSDIALAIKDFQEANGRYPKSVQELLTPRRLYFAPRGLFGRPMKFIDWKPGQLLALNRVGVHLSKESRELQVAIGWCLYPDSDWEVEPTLLSDLASHHERVEIRRTPPHRQQAAYRYHHARHLASRPSNWSQLLTRLGWIELEADPEAIPFPLREDHPTYVPALPIHRAAAAGDREAIRFLQLRFVQWEIQGALPIISAIRGRWALNLDELLESGLLLFAPRRSDGSPMPFVQMLEDTVPPPESVAVWMDHSDVDVAIIGGPGEVTCCRWLERDEDRRGVRWGSQALDVERSQRLVDQVLERVGLYGECFGHLPNSWQAVLDHFDWVPINHRWSTAPLEDDLYQVAVEFGMDRVNGVVTAIRDPQIDDQFRRGRRGTRYTCAPGPDHLGETHFRMAVSEQDWDNQGRSVEPVKPLFISAWLTQSLPRAPGVWHAEPQEARIYDRGLADCVYQMDLAWSSVHGRYPESAEELMPARFLFHLQAGAVGDVTTQLEALRAQCYPSIQQDPEGWKWAALGHLPIWTLRAEAAAAMAARDFDPQSTKARTLARRYLDYSDQVNERRLECFVNQVAALVQRFAYRQGRLPNDWQSVLDSADVVAYDYLPSDKPLDATSDELGFECWVDPIRNEFSYRCKPTIPLSYFALVRYEFYYPRGLIYVPYGSTEVPPSWNEEGLTRLFSATLPTDPLPSE